ncbi:MAG: biotin transporter BioY [Bacteroidota bacterium]
MFNLKSILPKLILAIAAIALSAQLTIPLPLVPITAQSLVVLLVGYVLKSRLAAVAVVGYLLAGSLGLPVFAEATAGVDQLRGNSGGFLYGFIFGAFVVGQCAERAWGHSFFKSFLAMLFGTAIILTFGLVHLSYHIGLEKAIQYGLLPFLIGAFIKIVLGAVLMWQIERLQ